ncbi:hypothetical protein, partial [Klebsiella pneumoniae]|uniref:hypothetical protein n=1 Tax=Klebsiella pneumoniae TaxID=573 RepID=UPI001D11F99B
MFYIATNNHYLFVGLDSLLKPYKSKKIRTIKRNNPKHLNFSAGDTIFFHIGRLGMISILSI